MRKLFLSAFAVTALAAIAQNQYVELNWQAPTTLSSGKTSVRALYFKGAHYNMPDDALPRVFLKQDLSGDPADFEVKLLNTAYEALTTEELQVLGDQELPNQIEIRPTVGWIRKQPVARVDLLPLRRNPATGQMEKLTSFTWRITEVRSRNASGREARNSSSWATNSVLATGQWYRIGVTKKGMYKLDRDALNELGLNVNSLNPRTLKVYGGGGGMLPVRNEDPRVDDLQELNVRVVGEADGSMDAGDYLLFYAEGPGKWTLNEDGRFEYEHNVYCDTNYYYITSGGAAGKRVTLVADDTGTPTHQVSTFVDYTHHENDWTNLVASGRKWFGEYFDITPSYNFTFGFDNLIISEPVWVRARAVGRSSNETAITVTSNNQATPIIRLTFDRVGSGTYDDYVSEAEGTGTYINNLFDNVILTTTYQDMGVPGSIAWLDFIEVNATRLLKHTGKFMGIIQPDVIGSGNLAEYTLQNANGVTLWEVTDPFNVKALAVNHSGSSLSWKRYATVMRSYVSFTGNDFLRPALFGSVLNQNLHGTPLADMFIVAPGEFFEEARRLADFHKRVDGMSVTVVTPRQIYNEFSSGRQDVSAIRDFMRMYYERATTPAELPTHLLLFGDCSYDYKDILSENTNFVPTFQSQPSFNLVRSFCTDDFFGCLDPTEGSQTIFDALDLAIGRLPVKTVDEARAVVNKIIQYYDESSLGDWTQRVLFVADDVDSNWETDLIGGADRSAMEIDTRYPEFNIQKIYSDSYTQVTNAAGESYPDAMIDLRNQIERGVLLINYVGHGGETGWASEGILNVSDVRAYENFERLNVMLTITCEFSRFDDPGRVSAGEFALLNPNGCSVALFSTTRVVWVGEGNDLNGDFYEYAFEKDANGNDYTFGEIMRLTKNRAGTDKIRRRFGLLGDPALRFLRPEYDIRVTTVNQTPVASFNDTLNALSLVQVSGIVNEPGGEVKRDFNGILYATVYDKYSELQTLANDGAAPPIDFVLQQNVIFKGKASINEGNWSYNFIVPIDIAYKIDYGKLSHYAIRGTDDAAGAYEDILIGGTSDDPITDGEGPKIELYMNDETFVFGGLTDESPDIFALLFDSLGINVVGNGIGHDLISVLDRNSSSPIILNDFYEANVDDYTSGSVRYPLRDIASGRHHLYMKAWDVANNSAEAETEFVVAESAELALDHVLNYPNPFTTYTEFHFEHNRPAEPLEVQVQIFTVSGKLVRTLNANVTSNGFRVSPITWNGLDEYGDEIGRGVYVYRLKVRSMADNSANEKYEKLVILR